MNSVLKTNCRLVDARTPLKIGCHLRKWSRIAMRMTRFFSSRRRSVSVSGNYYEILGVKRDSTTKEIKKAFFRLSKELHPDRNPSDSSLTARFIKLNEAYSVLGRSSSRFEYDRSLDGYFNPNPYYQSPYGERHEGREWTSQSAYSSTRPDDSFWENRDRSKDSYYDGKPYYGIKGLNWRLPNWWIVAGCFVILVLGACSHYLAIRLGNRISLEAQDKKDRINLDLYLAARIRAKERGNSGQLMWFKELAHKGKDPESSKEKSGSSEEELG